MIHHKNLPKLLVAAFVVSLIIVSISAIVLVQSFQKYSQTQAAYDEFISIRDKDPFDGYEGRPAFRSSSLSDL